MDWFRANYDRAAALAAALFLILCAGFIFLGASGFGEKFGALQSCRRRITKSRQARRPEIVEAMAQLQSALAVDFQRTLRALRAGKTFYRPGWPARDFAKHAPPSACA